MANVIAALPIIGGTMKKKRKRKKIEITGQKYNKTAVYTDC